MGTRRSRDLHQRPDVSLALYDGRADRRAAAESRFGVKGFAQLDAALAWDPQALIISTPPGTKGACINLAFDRGLHHFSEADMWTYGAVSRGASARHLVGVPSGSMSFLPLFKNLGPLLRDNLGAVLGYQFYLSTFMPAWHPSEGLEYYARHRNTAPAREMIPFELSWLNAVFGPASEVAGRFEKFGTLSGEIEDTWSLSMRLRNGGMGQLTVTMACPTDCRRGGVFWHPGNGCLGRGQRGGHPAGQGRPGTTPIPVRFGGTVDRGELWRRDQYVRRRRIGPEDLAKQLRLGSSSLRHIGGRGKEFGQRSLAACGF